MRVFAVLVNWNGGANNRACVDSLVASGLPADRVVMVDNASTDGAAEEVAAAHPGLVVLRNERNEGYGHGTNRGVGAALDAGADAVLLINNDAVLSEGTLDGLVARLAGDPTLGVVGPRILYLDDPGRVWAAGGDLTFRQNLSTLRGHGAPDGPAWRRDTPVDYLTGCAMLVRREVFERVGMLDGDYFAYHEDLEFCVQVGAAGFGILCAGGLAALHGTHASTGGGYNPRRKYMMGVNSIWFLRRHGSPMRWLRFAIFDVATLPLLWLAGLFNGRSRSVAAKALGTWHGLRGRRVTSEVVEAGGTSLW